MRICIVRHYYYPQEGHVRRDAQALAAIGYEVDVICLRAKGQKLKEKVDDINVYRIPIQHRKGSVLRYFFEYSLASTFSFMVLSVLFMLKEYSAVEVDTMPDFLVFSALIPRVFGAKIILYMFDPMPELYISKNRVSEKNTVVKLLKTIEQASTRFADRVITTTATMKEVFSSRGTPPSKIVVVLNVPDERLFPIYTPHLTNERREGDFALIYHGTIAERYGLDTAIKAIPLLRRFIPELRFYVVGDGEYVGELRSLVNRLELRDRVIFTGFVAIEEIPSLVHKADIGIVPLVKDVFIDTTLANKIFEYIALGKPVVVSKIKAVQRYFDESSLAFFSSGDEEELAQVILALHNEPRKMMLLVDNARRVYEKYRWNREKQKYLGVYEAFLGDNDR